jgi:thioredoxin reductase
MINHLDYLIIGGGPAGIQLGYFLQQNGSDYLILEKGKQPGTFFTKFPRHRYLISINKVNTGKDNAETRLRYDWNSLLCDNPDLRFTNYSDKYFPHPDVLLRYLHDFVDTYQLNIQYNTEIIRVSKVDDHFLVTAQNGEIYTGKRLVLATGFMREYTPPIPGIEHAESYGNHSLDLEDYRDKRVLIIGKGNSAFETAEHLIESAAVIHICSPSPVKFAWQTHYVGNLRAVNNNFLDTYQLKSQNVVIDASINTIEKIGDQFLVHLSYSHAKGQTRLNHYDKIIYCTGFRFDRSIFDESCQPETVYDGKFPAQTMEWESTNVPGMFVAGTLMHACDFKKTMSGFIHGFRHNIESLANIFEMKYHGRELPHTTFSVTSENVLKQVLERFNSGAGMFLQPGFLSDVVVVDEATGIGEVYRDIRKEYVHESPIGQYNHYYVLTLEYGHFGGDPFNTERDPDPEKANEASYLHPIIRRYNHGKLVTEFHIQDDLENEWVLDDYVIPTRNFFREQIPLTPEANSVIS